MSYDAGSAYISIRPDFSDFSDDIKAEMASQGDQAGQAFADAFKAEVEESLAGLNTDIAAGADTSELDAELDEATRDRTATITLDDSELASEVAEADAELDDAARDRTARFIVDSSGVAEDIAAIDADLDDLARDRTAKISLDDSDLAVKTAADDALLDDTAKERTSTVDLDDSDTSSKLDDIVAKLNGLSNTTAKPKVDDSSFLDVPPLILAIGAGIATLGPEAAGAAVGVGLLGGAFGAAAEDAGGLSNAEQILESKFMDGANSVQGFGSTLASVGGTSLHDFEGAASDAGAALGTLFIAFAPEIESVAKDVEGLAADFESWAKGIQSSGVEDWLSKTFSPQTIAELTTDFKDLVNIIENIAKAVQDISPVFLGDLTAALDVLRLIPPGVIAALIAMFAAMKGASLISSGISKIGDLLSSDTEEEGAGTGESTSAGEAAGAAYSEGFKGGLAGLTAAVTEALGTLEEGAGEAEGAGTAAAEAYVGGFTGGLSGMSAAVTEAVATLEEGAGEAEGAGTATAGTYVAGFESGLAGMGAAVTGALGELEEGAGEAEGAGSAAGAAYTGGFEEGLSGLSGVAAEMFGSLAEGAEEAEGAGTAAGEALAEGFGEAAAELPEILLDIVADMAEVAGEGGEAAGAAMAEGMAMGLAEGAPLVEAEAEAIAAVARATIEAALLIESPSRVGRGIGANFGGSIALGMHDSLDDVASAAHGLADVSVSSLAGIAASQSLGALAAVGAGQSLPGVGTAAVGAGAAELRLSWGGGGDDVTNAIVKGLRVSIGNATGGDVQAHLGRGKVRT